MNDTYPHIIAKLHEMIQTKTFLERIMMGSSAYQLSKQIVISSILNDHPDISRKELRRKIFERFYSSDFTKEKMEKILKHLDEHVPNDANAY